MPSQANNGQTVTLVTQKTFIMSYYFYHNPDVVPHITIHKSDCGDCQHGQGKHKNRQRGLRGVWTGEFDEKDWAVKYIKDNIKLQGYEITYCERCRP